MSATPSPEASHFPPPFIAPVRATHRASLIGGWFAIAVALIVLAGWAYHNEALKAFIRGEPPMNPLTACCLIAAGVALICLQRRDAGVTRKCFGRLMAALVASVGVIRLIAYAAGWDAGVDHWLWPNEIAAGAESAHRIALRTAIDLILTGAALLLLDWQTSRGRRPMEWLSATAGLIAFLALLGYAYGVVVYYRTSTYVPMSLPGAIAFFSLAIGTLFARPDRGVIAVIVSNTAAGLLTRLLLPLAVLVPLFLGAARLAGERAGWYSTQLGVVLFATVFIIFFLISIWWTARLLFRTDIQRQAAEAHARELNAQLEQRVADRTAELSLVNQELQQASHAKDHFLAVLSHELRTPLTPALAAASYLADHVDLPDEIREEISTIRANVQLEARLIDDLLDLTRIARGQIELHLETVDAHHLVRKTLEIAQEGIRENQLDVVTELHAAAHHVAADPIRLQQVWWNLINNAVKFTRKGGRISIRSSNHGERFVVEITDSGIGIEPEQQGRIFAAFEQGEHSFSRQFGGLGLGLAISKTLLDLHGGTISVRSEGKNHGASFQVTLDTVAAPDHATSAGVPAAQLPVKALELLLVEDHAQTLRILSGFLRKRGHKVRTADSVEGALRLLDEAAFDALISDIGLPDGTGCDIMRAAKGRGALRGIALSGFGMEEDVRRSLDAGFDHHLTKPIDFQDLDKYLGTVAAEMNS